MLVKTDGLVEYWSKQMDK